MLADCTRFCTLSGSTRHGVKVDFGQGWCAGKHALQIHVPCTGWLVVAVATWDTAVGRGRGNVQLRRLQQTQCNDIRMAMSITEGLFEDDMKTTFKASYG